MDLCTYVSTYHTHNLRRWNCVAGCTHQRHAEERAAEMDYLNGDKSFASWQRALDRQAAAERGQ